MTVFLAPHQRKIEEAEGIIRDGLISRWPFDDGTGSGTFRDDQSSNVGTLDNMDPQTAWVPGRTGSDVAVRFGGSPQMGTVPHAAELNVGTTMSLVVWFKQNADPALWATLVGKDKNNWGDGYLLHFRPVGNLRFSPKHYNRFATIPIAASDRDWHLAIGTYDGATARIYLDNVEGTPGSHVEVPITTLNPLTFAWSHGSGGVYLNADVQDCRLYNRVLSASERTAIFNGTG